MSDFYVDNSTVNGRGCFASRDIAKNESFEFPTIPYDSMLFPFDWRFEWVKEAKIEAIVIGPVTFCNHSKKFNIETVSRDWQKITMTFMTTKAIKKDEEVFLSYGKDVEFALIRPQI